MKLVRDIRLGIPEGGYGGSASDKASAEWGDAMMPAIVDYFCEFADAFRKIPLDRPNDR